MGSMHCRVASYFRFTICIAIILCIVAWNIGAMRVLIRIHSTHIFITVDVLFLCHFIAHNNLQSVHNTHFLRHIFLIHIAFPDGA